ncbi:MAG TPA: GGDEF domain-containing protein [Xanthobacteraceae bacterium]|nr:GGDEF domain-containing protein [Xanthobacteraceae bacterium]
MDLDVNTLFLVTIYVESLLGLLLLFAWVQNTAIHAVAWWASAHFLRAASITLFGAYGQLPDLLTIDLANAVLLTSFAATWTGARLFEGRRLAPAGLVAGAAVWLIANRLPVVASSVEARAWLGGAIIASYTWLACAEFWRGRAERLVSRLPAMVMLFAHGALFLLRTPLSVMLPWAPSNHLFGSVWLTVLSSEALLLTIAIAFILLAMGKERAEQSHRTAALVDPLTGLVNRRGFFAKIERISERQAANPQLAAVLLVDLDHFKSINDRFGHAVGDRVLQVFAESATQTVRPSDFVGRLGGEEFAAVLHNIGRERALVIAERMRVSFAQASQMVDGCPVGATASVGLAFSDTPDFDLSELLVQADKALYEAKERGRNRVEVANDASLRTPDPAASLAQSAA